MKDQYDFKAIEEKWQKRWEQYIEITGKKQEYQLLMPLMEHNIT